MGANRINSFTFHETKIGYLNQREDKFKLVSCPINKFFCNDVLLEINELYTESESARFNKEYQNSIELLQKAYYKTLKLDETVCAACVNLFQSSIYETLESIQEELHEMSSGLFGRKSNQLAYEKLNTFLRKIDFFKIGEAFVFSKKRITG